MKVLAELVPGESPFPGLQMATCLLCPHTAEGSDLSSSFYKETNRIIEALPS